MAKVPGKPKKNDISIKQVGMEMGGLLPPQSREVEEAVLGALMVEPKVVPDVLDSLNANCFYVEANRKIFQAISALAMAHEAIDYLTQSHISNTTILLKGSRGIALEKLIDCL